MSNYIVSSYEGYNSHNYNSQHNSNNICFDMKIGDLFMNNTIIQMLNMLQTIISSLPMNTTNINNGKIHYPGYEIDMAIHSIYSSFCPKKELRESTDLSSVTVIMAIY